MNLEIITPDKKVYAGVVDSVILPGSNGGFQILNNHAPIISALKEGKLIVELPVNFNAEINKSNLIHATSDAKKIEISIAGGVAELTNNKVIILAE